MGTLSGPWKRYTGAVALKWIARNGNLKKNSISSIHLICWKLSSLEAELASHILHYDMCTFLRVKFTLPTFKPDICIADPSAETHFEGLSGMNCGGSCKRPSSPG